MLATPTLPSSSSNGPVLHSECSNSQFDLEPPRPARFLRGGRPDFGKERRGMRHGCLYFSAPNVSAANSGARAQPHCGFTACPHRASPALSRPAQGVMAERLMAEKWKGAAARNRRSNAVPEVGPRVRPWGERKAKMRIAGATGRTLYNRFTIV